MTRVPCCAGGGCVSGPLSQPVLPAPSCGLRWLLMLTAAPSPGNHPLPPLFPAGTAHSQRLDWPAQADKRCSPASRRAQGASRGQAGLSPAKTATLLSSIPLLGPPATTHCTEPLSQALLLGNPAQTFVLTAECSEKPTDEAVRPRGVDVLPEATLCVRDRAGAGTQSLGFQVLGRLAQMEPRRGSCG